jgi:hypothetical protein
MSKPQQPEIARSRRAPTDQDSFELKAAETSPPPRDRAFGKTPPENRPGHHPETEQDKPAGPPA